MKHFTSGRAHGLVRRRVAAGATAAVLSLGALTAAGWVSAAQAADPVATSAIILGVGANETQRTVTWYASANVPSSVQVAPTSRLVAGDFPADALVFPSTVAANATNSLAGANKFNAHSTITGLQESTDYSYRVGSADTGWSPVYTFKTHDFEGDFDFLAFGDPQIGASGDVARDAAGWVDTVNVAAAANPDAELFVSAGDEVETANNEAQWDAFLSPAQLKSYPWAATIGNHDVGAKSWEQHHYVPNRDDSALYYSGGTTGRTTQSGGDYWYIFKDVLFLDLNSNSYVNTATNGSGGDTAHINWMTDVVNAHGAEAKYTVVTFHHSIYSPADHANDTDNQARRRDFPAAMSRLGVDLVLQGHDHSWSRSYMLKDGKKANANEQPGASEVFQGPGGVVYVTAATASGSKYYDLTRPTTTDPNYSGADPLDPTGKRHVTNSVENQEHVRNYVKVQVRRDKLVVQDIRSGTCAAPNAAVELNRVAGCGTDGTGYTAPGGGVGSFVDNVTIRPYRGTGGEDISVDVPTAAPGEFSWSIDGTNGLVDLGKATEDGEFFVAKGGLNPITITDTRRTKAPFTLNGQAGAFTDAAKTFSSKWLGWGPYALTGNGVASPGGYVFPGSNDGDGLSSSRTLASGVQGHARGAERVGAQLNLRVPSSIDKGTYQSTLTITAVS